MGGAVGPRMFFIIPCIDEIRVVDLRTVSFDVPPQEILTKDSVTVSVDAVVYFNIRNPMQAVCNVADYSSATRLLSATTLRNILGTKTLSEVLSERESIAVDLKSMIDTATDPWGIDIERVEVKDVRLPQSLQRPVTSSRSHDPHSSFDIFKLWHKSPQKRIQQLFSPFQLSFCHILPERRKKTEDFSNDGKNTMT